MYYYLLIIYKGKGLEETLILSTRKFREAIFSITYYFTTYFSITLVLHTFSITYRILMSR